ARIIAAVVANVTGRLDGGLCEQPSHKEPNQPIAPAPTIAICAAARRARTMITKGIHFLLIFISASTQATVIL
ncbi:hypothetical protein OLZ32_03815, partial [Rhizobium sp. 1AS11]|uniref:hypothetical protein n=1 Tax=Rhizobium acaciae TaxID=2989736 RepID=UPI00222136C4